jgi:hypothetical protein
MKIYVDASVFAPTISVGHVSGNIELAAVPRRGELLSLMCSPRGVPFIALPGFGGQLRVVEVVHSVQPQGVSVSLEDIEVQSIEQARAVMRFLEDGFGLFAVMHIEGGV